MKVEAGTNPPTKPILKKREPIHLSALTPTTPLKPVRVNGLVSSQGFSDDVAGAWASEQVGQPLSGMERHICSMVDQGLGSVDELL